MCAPLEMEASHGSLLGKRLVVLNPGFMNAQFVQPILAKGFKKITPTIWENTWKNLEYTR
jgi:hypothetical protein